MLSANIRNYELKVSIWIVTGLSLLCSRNNVRAQVIGDRATDTQVKIEGNVAEILGGMQAGNNLFHSFKQFSIDINTSANFQNGLNVENIFSQVTGGDISQINGLIKTQGEANLFLINSAGIIFGADAKLDVGGSFIATTAEQVIFEDGKTFSAADTEERPILTVSSPIGLQYGAAGAVTVMANANRGVENGSAGLSVRAGNTLALLGGDVAITRNSLNAIASNVEIGSIKSGKVNLEPSDRGWNFNYENVWQFGRINLSNRAAIDSSGIVNLRGKTIDFAFGSGIKNFTAANGGGAVELNASESVNLDGSFLFTQVGQTSSNIPEAIISKGGNILIKAPKISLTDGSVVSAGTLSRGAGGNILLEGSQTIELSSANKNSPSIISTSTSSIGEGGDISLNAGRLTINDGSQIQAFAGDGKGGTITARATESIDISGTGILRSQDRSGNISEKILRSGFTASSGFENLPFELQPQGESGNLVIDTPELSIADFGHISVSNYGLSNAGNIKIAANNLRLDTAGKISANTASREGGSISVLAENLILLNSKSTISTSAGQNGNGGNIFLKADNLALLKQNNIRANAELGNGGNVFIDTQGYFIASDSKVTASSQIETKEGTIKIVNLDLDSRLHLGQKEHIPLSAGDYIATGCGGQKDIERNEFHSVGRGGIPINIVKETTNLDVLNDFGSKQENSAVSLTKEVFETEQNKPYSIERFGNVPKPIFEVNSWKTNSQGKIELIARHNSTTAFPACQFDR